MDTSTFESGVRPLQTSVELTPRAYLLILAAAPVHLVTRGASRPLRHSRPCHLSFLEAFRGSKQGSIDRSASTLFTTGLASGLWKRAAFCIQSLVDDRRGQGVRAPAGLSACLKYSYFQGHTRSIVCRLCQHRPGTRIEKRGQRAVRGVRKAVVVEGG